MSNSLMRPTNARCRRHLAVWQHLYTLQIIFLAAFCNANAYQDLKIALASAARLYGKGP